MQPNFEIITFPVPCLARMSYSLVGKTTITISDTTKPDRIRRPDKSTLMHQSVYIRLYQVGLAGTKKRKNKKIISVRHFASPAPQHHWPHLAPPSSTASLKV